MNTDQERGKQAMATGAGSMIDVKLGGKAGKLGSASVQGKAYVKSIGDGRYAVRFSAWSKAGSLG